MKIAIIGAGFSGLTLAWALQKRNIQVDVFEAAEKAGGLLATENSPMLVESAANALLASKDVEYLFSDLKLELLKTQPAAKNRWIFRGGARRWPLGVLETCATIRNFLVSKLSFFMTKDLVAV